MLFHVLGSLEVEFGDGAVVAPAGARVRALFAALLMHPNSVTPVHALVDAMWGEHPPAHAGNSVHVSVTRLRRALGPAGGRVVTRSPGYLLDLGGSALDADLFEQTCRTARSRARTDPVAAVGLYDEALGRWQGPAFAEFADSFAAPVAARLERLRVAAEEGRVEAMLLAGSPDAVAAADALFVADPLAAVPVAVLMRALARSGRAPEALRSYHRHAAALREQLGLDPSPALRDLHTSILRADASVSGRLPAELPPRPSPLIGRVDELTTVGAALGGGEVVTVVGPGGVGKTRVALEIAHRWNADRRGVWWVDLVPVDPSRVLDAIAAATGVELPPGTDPTRVLCTALAPTRGLLILDNAEHVLDVVARVIERLGETAPGIAVLATSRERLCVDGEKMQMLLPLPLPVGVDPDNAAVRLFLERAPGLGPLTDDALAVVGEMCRRLDGLPLAIELGAARAATLGLDALCERLGAPLDLLGGARRTADHRHRTLRAVLAWSHRLLTDDEALLFRRLAIFPAEFTLAQVEAVCVNPRPPSTNVAALLARLVDQSLVQTAGRSRFRLLETLRAFAREQLETTGELDPIAGAHAHDTADRLADTSPRLWTDAEPEAVRELTDLTPDLHAAWRYAVEHDRSLALRLAADIYYFAFYRQRLTLLAWGLSITTWSIEGPGLGGALGTAACALWGAGRVADAAAVVDRGVIVAGGPDTIAGAVAAQESGTIAMILGDTDTAVTRYRRLATARRGRREPVLALLVELGAVHALVTGGRTDEAAELIDDLRAAACRSDNPTVTAWAHYLAGEITAHADPRRAAAEYRAAIDAGEPADSRLFVTLARASAAALAARTGNNREALTAFAEVLEEWIRLGNTGLISQTLQQIVALLSDIGRYRDAAVLAGALHGQFAGPAFATDTDRCRRALCTARDRLGADQTTSALAEGAGQSVSATLATVRKVLRAAFSATPSP